MARDFDLETIIETDNVERVLGKLETAVSPVGLAAFLKATVDPYLRGRARERFANEGDNAVGGKWVPLTSATQSYREAAGFGGAHPINHRTGSLEAYITGAADVDPMPFGAQLTLPGGQPTGLMLKKVSTAQKGDPERSTPARPVVGMDTTDLAFVLTSLFYFVEGSARA